MHYVLAMVLAMAQLDWRSIGPAVSGGRIAAVVGTDRDPALYYAGAAGGGVWKTTDAGQRWEPVFDKEGIASIGAIAIDPNDENVVWVGTGEPNSRNDVSEGNGVYTSSDGGKTWARVLALRDAQISSISIDPRNSKRILVGVAGDPFADSAERGVYRTVDGGKTWKATLYLGTQTGASDLARDPSSPDVVYAGMWQFRRTPWSVQSGGPQDGLYRSGDGGLTWTQLNGNGLPAGQVGRIAVAIAPSRPARVYALIQSKDGLLWRSDDGGATWAMVSADTLIDERPFYFSRIYVDPSDSDRIWSDSVSLTLSVDGGKNFVHAGSGLHGDHHAMWIAANGKRIIEGNDGGVGFSYGGKTWARDNVLPIAQVYHVGVSGQEPYRVCVALQDDGIHCAFANPLDRSGITAGDWAMVGGGDGTFAEFDPHDPQLLWESIAGGNNQGDVYIENLRTGEQRAVAPYPRDQNVVDPAALSHRFNWETPIVFDPFDSRVAYVGGETVFVTPDRGVHWKPVGGDLTRNIREHQVITGGITREGTGAETADTILAIAPSPVKRGEIWVGTDDGLLQLTRDGGAHWQDVTPAGIAPLGRFASISPSNGDAATAYAVYDRHMLGDRNAYVFATQDYGAHWSSLAGNLSGDDEARSIFVDPHNPQLLYLGRERSLWASWDAGGRWERLENLPPASVRDIRLAPQTNDLVIATHGRGVYVLDDATPLQQLEEARAAGEYIFPIRPATLWQLTESIGHVDGEAPPYGAIVTYYLASPDAQPPTAEIVDLHGDVVRHFADRLPNEAGLNRFVWDLSTDAAIPWTQAPDWNQGYAGIAVPPGTYTVKLHVGSRSFERSVIVRGDPRLAYTPAQYAAAYALQKLLLDDLSRVDRALDVLDRMPAGAPKALSERAARLVTSITANPRNDQDDDFLTDGLRERLQAALDSDGSSFAPPTPAQRREAAALHALTEERLAAFAVFSRDLESLENRSKSHR